MKKASRRTIICTIMLACWSCSQKQVDNHRNKDGLKGNVRMYTQLSYDAEVSNDAITLGEPLNDKVHGMDHDIKLQKFYDRQGHEEITVFINSDKTIKVEAKPIYNDEGLLIERKFYNSIGVYDWSMIYKHDNKGNIIEVLNYSKKGDLLQRTSFSYDSKGNKIQQNVYDDTGKWETRDEMSYNSNGLLVKKFKYYAPNTYWYTESYDYDSYNNLIEKKLIKKDRLFRTWSYQYKYDDMKNWIQKITFRNGYPSTIITREYVYY